ncbi:hypothetical protein [Mucilaginibacter ginkgonis]|uniref:Uncharacterized protein n=1 Tax=Mucilaginibacter ginkgonis TaxID=2682091 RepID=A0A6I4I023_9SPHI|nr:hypothetical protein [Mucilaginibacter ginkgonis]QQL49916.1 hypothetical protein GO620_000245 [Mucilaginibacter ginkgonis]
MDRINFSCELSGKVADIQLDIKKIPGEHQPCYMVSVDGLFKGYLKKDTSGQFDQFMSPQLSDEDLAMINKYFAK